MVISVNKIIMAEKFKLFLGNITLINFGVNSPHACIENRLNSIFYLTKLLFRFKGTVQMKERLAITGGEKR